MEQRVAALSALCHAVMDGPAVRSAMDARLDEAHNRRRMHWEETKVCASGCPRLASHILNRRQRVFGASALKLHLNTDPLRTAGGRLSVSSAQEIGRAPAFGTPASCSL